MTVVGPPEARPADGLAIDFVVESDRAQLSEIVQRVRDGRLRTNIGNVATLDDAVAAKLFSLPLHRLAPATVAPAAEARSVRQNARALCHLSVRLKRIQPVRGPHLFLRRPRQRAKVGPARRGAGGDR